MRLDEQRGVWWLPDRPEGRVHGLLTFSRDQGGRLDLAGALRGVVDEGTTTHEDGVTRTTVTEETLEASAVYPTIHGEVGNTELTLIDCLMTHRQTGIFGQAAHEVIHVGQVFKGACFEPNSAPDADSLSVEMKHLAHWVMRTGLDYGINDSATEKTPSVDHVWSTARARALPDETVVMDDGLTVKLGQTLSTGGDRVTAVSLTQGFYWRLEGRAVRPVEELLSVAGDLQALVSIATGRTAEYEGLTFWHPDAVRSFGDGIDHRQPIEMFAQWNARDRSESQPPRFAHEMLFTLPMLGGLEGVGKWLDAARTHRGALGRVMGSRYAPAMFVSDRLLNRAAAIEAFDRTRRSLKKNALGKALAESAALASPPFGELVPDLKAWTKPIFVHRDDVAHHLGRARDSTHTYLLGESLYWLFVICILREANAPQAVFEHMKQHDAFRWLKRRLPAALDS